MSVPFEDLYPSFTVTGYFCTNEEPELYRQLLRKQPLKNVGCIASGGDVPMFVFLARGTKVIAIDHSYHSLTACAIKVELLRTRSPRQFKELFTTDRPYAEVKAVVTGLIDRLPEVLQQHARSALFFTLTDYANQRKETHFVPLSVIAETKKYLDKLTLLHGDISDLSKYGPFDCLYISNILGHYGRDRRPPLHSSFKDLLRPKGILVSTGGAGQGNASYTKFSTTDWQKVYKGDGFRSYWGYEVLQRLPEGASVQATAQVAA